jgi:hypothetical protein
VPEATEEIIGQVDRTARAPEPSWSDDDDDDDSDEEGGGRARTASSAKSKSSKKMVDMSEAFTYVDSGDEDSEEELEGEEKDVSMEVDDDDEDDEVALFEPRTIAVSGESGSDVAVKEEQDACPFVLPGGTEREKKEEEDGFLLFKFPTRLPRVAKEGDAPEEGLTAAGADLAALGLTNAAGESEPPAEAPTADGSSSPNYDESWSKTPAGQYGTVVMYASGRCELVLTRKDGGKEIRMEMEEGIDVGFKQDAVIIDTDLADESGAGGIYHRLGNISKSIVVCPVLEE